MRVRLDRAKLKEIRAFLKEQKVAQVDVDALMDSRESLFIESFNIKARETEKVFKLPFEFIFIEMTPKKGEVDYEESR